MVNYSVWHRGELAAQKRAGAEDIAVRAAPFLRDHMLQQHRDFHTSLPFVVMTGQDEQKSLWTTVLEGQDGFIQSPDERSLTFAATPTDSDPLAHAITNGTDIGMLGIQLSTRRRNRLSGCIRASGERLRLDVRQAFGNCPRYIHKREWRRVTGHSPGDAPDQALASASLAADQIERIARADTLFIGSGQQDTEGEPSNGFDSSHRGGEAGFVRVIDATHLSIPDYAGNNFFNTIGNLIEDPRVALLFIDFETGGMLHISGNAMVEWEPSLSHDSEAERMIHITVESVIDRPSALSLRWDAQHTATR